MGPIQVIRSFSGGNLMQYLCLWPVLNLIGSAALQACGQFRHSHTRRPEFNKRQWHLVYINGWTLEVILQTSMGVDEITDGQPGIVVVGLQRTSAVLMLKPWRVWPRT